MCKTPGMEANARTRARTYARVLNAHAAYTNICAGQNLSAHGYVCIHCCMHILHLKMEKGLSSYRVRASVCQSHSGLYCASGLYVRNIIGTAPRAPAAQSMRPLVIVDDSVAPICGYVCTYAYITSQHLKFLGGSLNG